MMKKEVIITEKYHFVNLSKKHVYLVNQNN